MPLLFVWPLEGSEGCNQRADFLLVPAGHLTSLRKPCCRQASLGIHLAPKSCTYPFPSPLALYQHLTSTPDTTHQLACSRSVSPQPSSPNHPYGIPSSSPTSSILASPLSAHFPTLFDTITRVQALINRLHCPGLPCTRNPLQSRSTIRSTIPASAPQHPPGYASLDTLYDLYQSLFSAQNTSKRLTVHLQPHRQTRLYHHLDTRYAAHAVADSSRLSRVVDHDVVDALFAAAAANLPRSRYIL